MDVITVYLFVVGLFFGSFYNVVAERKSRNKSIIKPASHCENCKHKLNWYELIPVFSYIFLKGKCKVCHMKLSIQYPLIEVITGISFSLMYLLYGVSYNTLIGIVLVSIAIITFITDFKYYIILDEVVVVGFILITLLYIYFDINNVLFHLISSFVLFFIMLLIKLIGDKSFKRESLGWGDVKLSLIAGLVLGYKMGVFYIFFGSLIAIIPAIIISIKKGNSMIPFGPFLVTSLMIIFIEYDFFDNLLLMLIGG